MSQKIRTHTVLDLAAVEILASALGINPVHVTVNAASAVVLLGGHPAADSYPCPSAHPSVGLS